MAKKPLPTPEELRQLLRYDPETGRLFWRERPLDMFDSKYVGAAERSCSGWNKRYSGQEALTNVGAWGYKNGSVLGRWVSAHRVIWAMATGRWPSLEIDHINGDPSDNRISNLREVEGIDNQRNKRCQSNNTSGVTGVAFHKPSQRWAAYISDGEKRINLGRFTHKAEAVAARKMAEREYGYHANHGR